MRVCLAAASGGMGIIKNFGKIVFAFEPFFGYWDIEPSDITAEDEPVRICARRAG